MKHTLEQEKNLRLIQAEITDIKTEYKNGEKRVCGVVTKLGEHWRVNRVIICAGTYLKGKIFVGAIS